MKDQIINETATVIKKLENSKTWQGMVQGYVWNYNHGGVNLWHVSMVKRLDAQLVAADAVESAV